ncbi:hypothetical protein P7K49_012671, partial [Saguinus oedipus]
MKPGGRWALNSLRACARAHRIQTARGGAARRSDDLAGSGGKSDVIPRRRSDAFQAGLTRPRPDCDLASCRATGREANRGEALRPWRDLKFCGAQRLSQRLPGVRPLVFA